MIRQFVAFGCVGLIATATHLIFGAALLRLSVGPHLANTAGFATAFCVSFLGHRMFTFSASRTTEGGSFLRYLFLATTCYALHQSSFFVLVNLVQADPIIAMLIASVAVALLTFVAARYWAFRV